MPRLRTSARRVARWIRRRPPLAEVFGLDDRDRRSLAWTAERLVAADAHADAGQVYTLMAILWPECREFARLGEGVCLQLQGDLAGAERAYNEVLEAEPDNPFALANRAEVRCLTDRTADARADLALALAATEGDRAPAELRRRIERLDELAGAQSS